MDLKKLLTPDDVAVIDATAAINWVPKEPAKVLLPYIVARQEDEKETNLEKRFRKTQEVVDNYEKLASRCRELEASIEDRCKSVTVLLNKSNQLRVIEAMGRVFGIETSEITFEQYKRCIKELAELNNQATPSPENL